MANKDIMTREETMAFVSEMMAAALRDEEAPKLSPLGKRYIRPEYLEDAMDMVTRLISSKFENMPAEVSDEFEVQEVFRQKTDEMVANMVLATRKMLEKLTKKHP
ncbi:MAG: hypothetical protein EOS55_25540 [Mesorhizobium sp.]|nr:MAG: hypothetical protein EOS55_25540 [Mesorhizobium sp.]